MAQITKELLLRNGWVDTPVYMALKTSIIRLGWNPNTKVFIIGYGQLPRPITETEQLISIYRLCGLYDYAEKFVCDGQNV